MSMRLKLKSAAKAYGAYAAIAALAFGAAMVASSAFSGGRQAGYDELNRARGLVALGSEKQCARYTGPPSGWGDDSKAGMVHLHGGEFVFGSKLGYEDERPAGEGKTRVAGFWIDQPT
jgi:sulfatase modifying factor 1